MDPAGAFEHNPRSIHDASRALRGCATTVFASDLEGGFEEWTFTIPNAPGISWSNL